MEFTSDGYGKRLSTITEYSESAIDSDNNEPSESQEGRVSHPQGDSRPEEPEDMAEVKYFLVDDSPMAKFSRSIKWIYKKVSSHRFHSSLGALRMLFFGVPFREIAVVDETPGCWPPERISDYRTGTAPPRLYL
ncbi:hypothetical protein KM043_018131 [Ampulex compressa]|nr:hypothetical protein KM043_018131 [Ampulex compressa]